MPSFPEHFNGRRFYNPNSPQVRGLLDVLRWKMSSRPSPSPRFLDDVTPSVPPQRISGPELRITLVNHSTVLLQQQTLNILTDPIWAERASPMKSIGPRRRRAPGVRKEDLPPIDLVLQSHNHYDHLDLSMLRWLAKRDHSTFIVPRGVAKLLHREKIGPVHELDWGDSHSNAGITVHAVPALHFSGRGLFDRNKSLWCGYILDLQRSVYFAADTGFGNHFSQIRAAFGSPQIALLPIGAYTPEWFMSPIHMGPADAIRAQQILGAETAIAIHHGTFQLADDGIDVPAAELRNRVKSNAFRVLKNGEHVEIA